MKILTIFAISVVALAFAGCASTPGSSGTPSQAATLPAANTSAKAVKDIKFSVAAAGKASVAENESFVLADFEKAINADLKERKLIDGQSADALDVQITKVKIKHGATSYFAGPFAGADEITATVTLKGTTGKTEVISATFTSFGGILGTNKTESRLAALNKEFADKLTSMLVR